MPNDELIARLAEVITWRSTGIYEGTALKAFSKGPRFTCHGDMALRQAEDATLMEAAAALMTHSAPTYEQGVAAGLEMAAKVAEDKAQQWDGPRRDGWHACNDTADAIRALADQHKPSPAEEPMP